jgi:hypothetical protein
MDTHDNDVHTNLNYHQLLQLTLAKFENELQTKQITIDTLNKQILVLNDKINELQKAQQKKK